MADTSTRRAEQIAEGLYPHQVEGVAFLLGRRRSILADDMGLGKTRQSIIAMTTAEPQGPYLVVCPASVKFNWQRELDLALDPADTHIVGRESTPEPGFTGWVIINYDLLKREQDALARLPFKGFVFDEAHFLKNHRAQRSQLSRRLLEGTQVESPVVHVLTGTPLTNRPKDLFPLLQLVEHALGRSFLAFAKRYCDAHKNDYGYWISAGASNIEELTVQLQGIMLRRHKEDVLDLPSKQRSWIDVDVPDNIRDRINETMVDFLDDSLRTARGGRASIAMISGARRALAVAKVGQTLEYVQNAVDQGEKVVLFSCFTHATRRFEKKLGDAAVAVTGEVPTAKRAALIDRFQNDDTVRVFIGQIHAAGIGINLTGARQVVFNDLDWVPANHWQAEDRVHRIGQNRSVNVTYMVGKGTLEEFVRSVLEAKSALIDDIVEGRSLIEGEMKGEMDADMLAALRGMINHVGRTYDKARSILTEPEELSNAIRNASSEYLASQLSGLDATHAAQLVPVSEHAIAALASALTGPKQLVYLTPSSKGDRQYRIEVEGADLTCDCPGFSYRGMCKHVRELKDALAAGRAIPNHYLLQQ
ncbi:MAG: DEAD/DEAH box helicase [Pseudomonadota bacterium]